MRNVRATLALIVLVAVPELGAARITTAWTYQAMYEKADLVVVARPTSVSQSEQSVLLPNFSPDAKVFEMLAAFSVSLVLKGPATEDFQLYHFKLVDPYQFPMPGPLLVEFEPTSQDSYLMFLRSEKNGRYVPVTGQADASFAVVKLQGSAR